MHVKINACKSQEKLMLSRTSQTTDRGFFVFYNRGSRYDVFIKLYLKASEFFFISIKGS